MLELLVLLVVIPRLVDVRMLDLFILLVVAPVSAYGFIVAIAGAIAIAIAISGLICTSIGWLINKWPAPKMPGGA